MTKVSIEQHKDITGMLDRLSVAVDNRNACHISPKRRLRYHRLAHNQIKFLIQYCEKGLVVNYKITTKE
ncbi:MAG: hypothetical protein AAF518_28460 [Spirochaetota bacterium]